MLGKKGEVGKVDEKGDRRKKEGKEIEKEMSLVVEKERRREWLLTCVNFRYGSHGWRVAKTRYQ